MRYRTVKLLVAQVLPDILVEPGPDLPETPGPFVVLSGYGGPGEDLDGLGDNVAWQVLVAGEQNDFEDAEDKALAIDRFFLNWHSSRFDGLWISGIQRVGGAPAVLRKDDADRYQIACSYIFAVELAPLN